MNVANAPGIVASIEDASKRVSCKDFMDKLVGINVDGASVNLSKHKGVGTLLKEKRMFSRMLRVKSDWRDRLTRDHLDSLL